MILPSLLLPTRQRKKQPIWSKSSFQDLRQIDCSICDGNATNKILIFANKCWQIHFSSIHLSSDFHHLLYLTPINRPNFCLSECRTLLVAAFNDFHVLLLTKVHCSKVQKYLENNLCSQTFPAGIEPTTSA